MPSHRLSDFSGASLYLQTETFTLLSNLLLLRAYPIVRLAQLKDAASALMRGDEELALSWLHSPLDVLGGKSPLEHATTELGARDVENLIGRLRNGVFS